MSASDKYERMGQHVRAGMRKSHPESTKWSDERRDAYVYGGKRKAGWVPRRERLKRAVQRRKNKRAQALRRLGRKRS